jgi:hypothetical protein
MMRAICFTVFAGCSIAPSDNSSKSCPCLDGFTCKIEPKQCVQTDAAPTASLGCVIYTDGKLYCSNKSGVDIFPQPAVSSEVVNRLVTTYSWFVCWGTGELHADGNTTWYYTKGDIRGGPYGWLPSANVDTSSTFDADPAAYGFLRCP